MKRLAAVATVIAVCASAAVALAASSPTVTTGTATSVTNTSATVNGTVNPNGQSTTYAFQYGTTNKYGQETAAANAGSGSTAQNVSASLSNLTPGTTYHFRIVATNASGTSAGSDQTFTTTGTAPAPVAAPTVTTNGPTSIQLHGATVNGTVNPKGSPVKVYFEYGLSSVYGVQTISKSVPAGTKTVNVNAVLTGLEANQTYHYALVAQDAVGRTFVGADRIFRTSQSAASPTLRNLSITPVAFRAGHGATISYLDSQSATTRIVIQRIAAGVTKGGRCVAITKSNQKGHRCTRFITVGTVTHRDKAGRNRLRFSGRLHGHALARGRYRLRAQAKDRAGTSPIKAVRFRVL